MTPGSASARAPVAREHRLICALDVPSAEQALALVDRLGESVSFYKLGFELFLAGDYHRLVDALLHRGKRVFADLKLFDVPRTVGAAVRQLARSGVHLTTVHGNDAMLEAACAEKGDLGILAVTALTSLDRGDLEDLGFDCDAEALVLSRARRALAIGCEGVVSSGLEAARLREEVGGRLLIVTPGIRPVENRPVDDQKRVVSVDEAFALGADQIVVGRPIHAASDPRTAAEAIQETIAARFTT